MSGPEANALGKNVMLSASILLYMPIPFSAFTFVESELIQTIRTYALVVTR